jgi:transposase
VIRSSFEQQPVRTVAEACERIFQLTGLRRGPSQVRKFLKELGLKFQRVRMIPVPPQKTWPSTSKPKPLSTTPN